MWFCLFMIFFAIFYSTLIVSNDSRFTLYNYIVLIFSSTPVFGPFYKKYLTANLETFVLFCSSVFMKCLQIGYYQHALRFLRFLDQVSWHFKMTKFWQFWSPAMSDTMHRVRNQMAEILKDFRNNLFWQKFHHEHIFICII